jgi:hypothetical protein
MAKDQCEPGKGQEVWYKRELMSRPQVLRVISMFINARIFISLFVLTLALGPTAQAQKNVYPKEIRGYKVEISAVDVKKRDQDRADPGALLDFGEPHLVRVTPLGISLEIPLIVAPVHQKGHVDFMVFEDMVVNGTAVEIDEYHNAFDLPNKERLTLQEPLKFYLYLPEAVLAVIDEVGNSKETWPITGRIYVFGRFKKSFFTFKRCIPVELNLTVHNPLREK